MAAKRKTKKDAVKEYPPIEGVKTYYEGTKIVTREYRVKSGRKF